MITLPAEMFEKVMQTIGNSFAMNRIPDSEINKLISEVLQEWELFNPESELYLSCKENIIIGYNSYNKFLNEMQTLN